VEAIGVTKPFDPAALRIGRAFRVGLVAHVEAGKLLAAKKAELKHGEWLPWLKANAGALGFTDASTASRLMTLAADPALTHDLPAAAEVKKITRALWGNGTRQPTTCSLADLNLEPHQSYEWYTPPAHVALVKRVLGEIDVDPASCAFANKTVGARKFYTREQDGLTRPWKRRVYLNPPFQAAIIGPFVDKLIDQLDNGNTTEAIFNSHTPTDMDWFHKALGRAQVLCITKDRIQYIGADGMEGGSPRTGGAYFYFGRRPKRFAKVFGEIGTIVSAL
jgi:hypothetical protein